MDKNRGGNENEGASVRRARLESPQGIIVVSQDPTGVFSSRPLPRNDPLSLSARRGPCILFGTPPTRFLPTLSPFDPISRPIFVDIAFHSVASLGPVNVVASFF